MSARRRGPEDEDWDATSSADAAGRWRLRPELPLRPWRVALESMEFSSLNADDTFLPGLGDVRVCFFERGEFREVLRIACLASPARDQSRPASRSSSSVASIGIAAAQTSDASGNTLFTLMPADVIRSVKCCVPVAGGLRCGRLF